MARPGSRTLKDHVLVVIGGEDGIDDFAGDRLVPSTPLPTV